MSRSKWLMYYLIWLIVTFFREFEMNGRCSPANFRAFSVILTQLDKHRWMFRVWNWVPQYFGELAIRGVLWSFLNLGTKRDGRLASSFGQSSTLIKTKGNWQSYFCVCINSIFQKTCWRWRKSSTRLTLTFSECEWSASRPFCFTHTIWCWVGTNPIGMFREEIFPSNSWFPNPSSSDDQEIT